MKNVVCWVGNLIQVVNSVSPMGLAALTMVVLLVVVLLAGYIVVHAM
ncbi:MAG: hypothetical protein PHY09_04610 [Desulfuromonadaceae bacterium]|nr:hypothetical protein [Desulfuromonadaceae bacterium]MDD5104641.1 hypothetical protein [Desulfuromonadaceae bacterium]